MIADKNKLATLMGELNDLQIIYCESPNEHIAARLAELPKLIKREKANISRRAKDQAMRDMGLTKVRGALGGTYWE